jgi:hypothetical protein
VPLALRIFSNSRRQPRSPDLNSRSVPGPLGEALAHRASIGPEGPPLNVRPALKGWGSTAQNIPERRKVCTW